MKLKKLVLLCSLPFALTACGGGKNTESEAHIQAKSLLAENQQCPDNLTCAYITVPKDY